MHNSDILTAIRGNLPGFNAITVSQEYPDELRIKVSPESFKKVCFILHKTFSSAVVMLFACDARKETGGFVIHCVFLDSRKSQWVIVSTDVLQTNPSFDSIAKDIHSASLFERQIWEMFGIEPKGNPDLRRLHLHDEVWPSGSYPLRKDFSGLSSADLSEYRFLRVEGDGVFEVPVGPVHAGIIGPGHFRFSVAGEPIINLEIRLGFTHRGVEKIFEGKTYTEAIKLSECVSGDSCFAHSLAFILAAEKISGIKVTDKASYIRAIFLELERMYSHVNDIGGIAVDVGFSFPAAYASIIKEAILQLNEKISGNRYVKHVNVAGGTAVDIDEPRGRIIKESLEKIKYDFNELVKMLYSSVSFMDRIDGTGILRKKTAEDIGVKGLAGRASGIPVDLRRLFPGVYNNVKFRMVLEESGDVLARLRLRVAEFKESYRLIKEFISRIKKDEPCTVSVVPKHGSALGYVEGWRGPVLYWLQTDKAGLVNRCKVVDASFLNWQGLSYAALGNIIPDFPVCNKSFDLSYSGNDL